MLCNSPQNAPSKLLCYSVLKLLCQTWRVSAESLSITSGSRLPNWGPTLPSLTLSYPSFPFPPLPFQSPFPSLPLEVGPLNTARGMGSTVSSPNGDWGGAPSEIVFGAF